MYKKTIEYKDYNGEDRKEDFYFHISKPEAIELEVSEDGGLKKTIDQIASTKDSRKIVEIFKKVIAISYGERSLDGKYFRKVVNGRRLFEDFESCPAYEILYMELATNSEKAAEFVNSVIPKFDDKDLKVIEAKKNEIQQHQNNSQI